MGQLPTVLRIGADGDGDDGGGVGDGGFAFRKRFAGSAVLFYLAITALVIPSILVSLGVGLVFTRDGLPIHRATSGFGTQLTWARPSGLLVMFAVFDHFNSAYEEATPDQGASSGQTTRHLVRPITAPGLFGIALFGFTLCHDELARTLLPAGSYNTLPLQITGMTTNVTTPVISALATPTTGFSLVVIGSFQLTIMALNRCRARAGSDAGKRVQGAAALYQPQRHPLDDRSGGGGGALGFSGGRGSGLGRPRRTRRHSGVGRWRCRGGRCAGSAARRARRHSRRHRHRLFRRYRAGSGPRHRPQPGDRHRPVRTPHGGTHGSPLFCGDDACGIGAGD